MRLVSVLLLAASSLQTVWSYNWNCNLHCFNDGTCMHGKGKFGSFAGLEETTGLPFAQEDQIDGMFCSCPVGFTGLQCEIKFVVCGADGKDEHTCFNGSDCKKDRNEAGKVFYRCECDAAQSDLTSHVYAGQFCEHESTVFCVQNKAELSGESFCVNGGACKAVPEGQE
jgi:hypothetical protein